MSDGSIKMDDSNEDFDKECNKVDNEDNHSGKDDSSIENINISELC